MYGVYSIGVDIDIGTGVGIVGPIRTGRRDGIGNMVHGTAAHVAS